MIYIIYVLYHLAYNLNYWGYEDRHCRLTFSQILAIRLIPLTDFIWIIICCICLNFCESDMESDQIAVKPSNPHWISAGSILLRRHNEPQNGSNSFILHVFIKTENEEKPTSETKFTLI